MLRGPLHVPFRRRSRPRHAAEVVDFGSGLRGWLDVQILSLATPVQIDDRSTNVVSALRSTYQKHLQPFEAHCESRLDPGACGPSKGRRPACDRPAHSAEAASEAADDAAEAAEILGSLMNVEHTAIVGQPPRKRLKMDAPDSTVRQSCYVLSMRHMLLGEHFSGHCCGTEPCNRSCSCSPARLASVCRTTSSPSIASCAKVAITKRRSYCATSAIGAATSSA